MPVSPDTISSTQKALCLYLLYLGTPLPQKSHLSILSSFGNKLMKTENLKQTQKMRKRTPKKRKPINKLRIYNFF